MGKIIGIGAELCRCGSREHCLIFDINVEF